MTASSHLPYSELSTVGFFSFLSARHMSFKSQRLQADVRGPPPIPPPLQYLKHLALIFRGDSMCGMAAAMNKRSTARVKVSEKRSSKFTPQEGLLLCAVTDVNGTATIVSQYIQILDHNVACMKLMSSDPSMIPR